MNKSFKRILFVKDMLRGLTLFMFLLLIGCLTTDQEVNRNTNHAGPVISNLPSGRDLIEIDSYELVEGHIAKDIEQISEKLGLTQLQKNVRLEEFEFRIWTNFGGRGDPKLLGLRKETKGSDNNAYFFEMGRHAESIKLRKDHLPVPKSGWNKVLFELRSRLTTPKGLVRDPNFDLNRDEPVILLEVLANGEYRRVFYGENTSFADGKRLIEACKYVASEFDVDMDCRGTGAE